MKKNFWVAPFVFLFVEASLAPTVFASPANTVTEVKSMREVVPSIEKGTLVVFDLDNTLIAPTSQLGSDQWFYYLYDVYAAYGIQGKEIDHQAMDTWNKAQWLIKPRAVEPETPAMIKG